MITPLCQVTIYVVHKTIPVRVYDPVLVIRHGSTCNPFTRLNSLWLSVTTPAPMATAWPASKVSHGPIGEPVRSRAARTTAARRAASASKGRSAITPSTRAILRRSNSGSRVRCTALDLEEGHGRDGQGSGRVGHQPPFGLGLLAQVRDEEVGVK